ncbi:hypothetical protein VNO77_26791 [Canavalia gladiata]|uniref:Transmembrane protein n=1 Tax=Canavalia gladiata TaxID=3824 RepID=A0AAN9KW10_CANGL
MDPKTTTRNPKRKIKRSKRGRNVTNEVRAFDRAIPGHYFRYVSFHTSLPLGPTLRFKPLPSHVTSRALDPPYTHSLLCYFFLSLSGKSVLLFCFVKVATESFVFFFFFFSSS